MTGQGVRTRQGGGEQATYGHQDTGPLVFGGIGPNTLTNSSRTSRHGWEEQMVGSGDKERPRKETRIARLLIYLRVASQVTSAN